MFFVDGSGAQHRKARSRSWGGWRERRVGRAVHFHETWGRQGIDLGQLTIHADGGLAMTSKPIAPGSAHPSSALNAACAGSL